MARCPQGGHMGLAHCNAVGLTHPPQAASSTSICYFLRAIRRLKLSFRVTLCHLRPAVAVNNSTPTARQPVRYSEPASLVFITFHLSHHGILSCVSWLSDPSTASTAHRREQLKSNYRTSSRLQNGPMVTNVQKRAVWGSSGRHACGASCGHQWGAKAAAAGRTDGEPPSMHLTFVLASEVTYRARTWLKCSGKHHQFCQLLAASEPAAFAQHSSCASM